MRMVTQTPSSRERVRVVLYQYDVTAAVESAKRDLPRRCIQRLHRAVMPFDVRGEGCALELNPLTWPQVVANHDAYAGEMCQPTDS